MKYGDAVMVKNILYTHAGLLAADCNHHIQHTVQQIILLPMARQQNTKITHTAILHTYAHDHYYCAHAQTNDSATMYEFRHSYAYGYEQKMYYKLATADL